MIAKKLITLTIKCFSNTINWVNFPFTQTYTYGLINLSADTLCYVIQR